MNKINRLCLLIGLMISGILLYPSFSMGQNERAWYAGDTHVHTAIHAISSIDKRIEEARKGGLDWVAITRHKRSGVYWKAEEVDEAAARIGHKIRPVLGVEWDEPPELGREDIVILGVNKYAPIPQTRLQDIIDYANDEGGVFIFAHPSPFVFQNIHKWKEYTAFEGHSGGRWNPACEPAAAWDQMLIRGDRIFIVGGSDNHNQPYLGEQIVKTYVLANSNQTEDIVGGIRAGRVYVSERDQSRITFQVNGGIMGETVKPDMEMLHTTITVTGKKPITDVMLVGNGKVLWHSSPGKTQFDEIIPVVATETLRYLRLIVETEKARTMSNPFFITQEGDLSKSRISQQKEHPLARWRAHVKTAPEAKNEAQSVLSSQMQMSEATDLERMVAVYGLIDLGMPEAERALTRLASDSSATVKAYAARMMAMSGMKTNENTLQSLLGDDDPRVRLWAVRTLERQPDISRSSLITMVNDEVFWVHFAAMEGLLDIAQQDSSLFDDLIILAKSGNLKVTELFSWAPAPKKQEVMRHYKDLYKSSPSSDVYRVLERLGISPASGYQMSVNRMNRPPVLDGRTDDNFWQTNKNELHFVQDSMDLKAIVQTGVKVGYDDTHLYLLFSCATLSTDDQDIEYALVGFDTNHNGGIDYTFEIDKNGRVQGEKDGIMDWNMEIGAKISLSSDGWIAEVAIPYAAIEWKKEIEKEVWGFNLSHGVRGQNTALTSWSPTLGQPSNAQRYGDLIFE